MAIFSGLFFVLFIKLGFWQLERATEKEELISAEEIRRSQPPVLFDQLPNDVRNLSGTPVRLKGAYLDDRIFLLDNRVLKGKVGFEVLIPYRVENGQLVLINRGFVPMARTRDISPEIPSLTASSIAEGGLYIGAKNSFMPEEVPTDKIEWPRIVQTSDPLVLQQIVGEDLYPYLFRLNEADSNALPRYWPTTMILPVKHRGYALQWFSMALAISVAFAFFTFRRHDD